MIVFIYTILAVLLASFVVYGTFFEIKWFDKMLSKTFDKIINFFINPHHHAITHLSHYPGQPPLAGFEPDPSPTHARHGP